MRKTLGAATVIAAVGIVALVFAQAPAPKPNVSAQGHWTPSTKDLVNPVLGHTHMDLQCDLVPYSSFNAPFNCNFTIKLFQTEGVSADFYAGILQGTHASHVVWDATGSAVEPKRRGNPAHHGLAQWTGHFTVEPDPAIPHGWLDVSASTLTKLDNGDAYRVNLLLPYFSTLDTTQPIRGSQEGQVMMASRVNPDSPRRPDVKFGANQMDIPGNNAFLFQPFSLAHPMTVSSIRYGTLSELPTPYFQLVRDLDLHNDIPGVEMQRIDNPRDSEMSGLDPAVLGPGKHKVAFMFTQPDGGIEQVTSLLVVDVEVGADVPPPPPPVCVFPQILQNGICVAPPPPPADSWVPVVPFFTQWKQGGVLTNRYQICTPAGCKEVQ